ncbi:hypothetical protein ACYJ1Y_06265 [Natrialbaceae archaeon A-gly3]
MPDDNIRFGVPLAALFVGLVVLVVGIFQSGLTTLMFVGGVIALLGVVGLTWGMFGVVAEDGSPSQK